MKNEQASVNYSPCGPNPACHLFLEIRVLLAHLRSVAHRCRAECEHVQGQDAPYLASQVENGRGGPQASCTAQSWGALPGVRGM